MYDPYSIGSSSSTDTCRHTIHLRESCGRGTAGGGELLPGSGCRAVERIVGAAAFDLRRNRIVSFGGSHSYRGTLGDTWEWNGAAWQEMAGTSVGRRDHHVLAYDEARGKTVLFGGNSGPAPWPTDTWEWDGVPWSRAAGEGPAGRSRTGMVYDGARKQMVLFGGAGRAAGSEGATGRLQQHVGMERREADAKSAASLHPQHAMLMAWPSTAAGGSS